MTNPLIIFGEVLFDCFPDGREVQRRGATVSDPGFYRAFSSHWGLDNR